MEKFPAGAKVCDLGGGNGHVLLEIMKTHPSIRGVVQDLPAMADGAHKVTHTSCGFAMVSYAYVFSSGMRKCLALSRTSESNSKLSTS